MVDILHAELKEAKYIMITSFKYLTPLMNNVKFRSFLALLESPASRNPRKRCTIQLLHSALP